MPEIKIHQGHAIDILHHIPDNSIHCVITSPPYWGLRAYGTDMQIWGGAPDCGHEWVDGKIPDKIGGRNKSTLTGGKEKAHPHAKGRFNSVCAFCGAWRGELGGEPSPDLFISHLMMVFDEIRRVLRSDGTCWINIGDSYHGSWGNYGNRHEPDNESQRAKNTERLSRPSWDNNRSRPASSRSIDGLKPKDLCLIPQRMAIALQDAGWWIRSDIIWAKTSSLPESIKDRPTKSHEYIFLCTKSAKYWYDADAIRTPLKEDTLAFIEGSRAQSIVTRPDLKSNSLQYQHSEKKTVGETMNPLGANARTVWTFSSRGYSDAHFATFPLELPRRAILAGCPEKICPECRAGWVRHIRKSGGTTGKSWHNHDNDASRGMMQGVPAVGRATNSAGKHYTVESLGFYPSCDCKVKHQGEPCSRCGLKGFQAEAEPCHVPGIVLDPFMGAGTTSMVAAQLARDSIGIELNPEYVEMAGKRIEDDAPLLNNVNR